MRHILNSFRIFFYILRLVRTLLVLIVLWACVWSEVSCCFLVCRAAGPYFPLVGGILESYSSIYGHWPFLGCLVWIRHAQQADRLYQNPHVVSYGSKNRRLRVKNKLLAIWHTCCINRRDFSSLHKTCCLPYVGLDLSIFDQLFDIHLVTQSLYKLKIRSLVLVSRSFMPTLSPTFSNKAVERITDTHVFLQSI